MVRVSQQSAGYVSFCPASQSRCACSCYRFVLNHVIVVVGLTYPCKGGANLMLSIVTGLCCATQKENYKLQLEYNDANSDHHSLASTTRLSTRSCRIHSSEVLLSGRRLCDIVSSSSAAAKIPPPFLFFYQALAQGDGESNPMQPEAPIHDGAGSRWRRFTMAPVHHAKPQTRRRDVVYVVAVVSLTDAYMKREER